MAEEHPDILLHLKSLFGGSSHEEKSLQIMEYFPAIIYVTDLQENKTTYINQRRISESLGFTSEEIQKWDCDMMKLIFKDDEEKVRKELGIYLDLDDEKDYSYDSRLNHKEGDWRYFRTRGRILNRDENGKPASLLFISEDITSETKSKSEITALRQLVDDTEKFLLFGNWSLDLSNDVLTCTEGMCSLLDYDRSIQGNIFTLDFYLSHLSGTDKTVFSEALKKAVLQKTDVEINYTLTSKTGRSKFISTKCKPVINADGIVEKLVGINRDITMIKDYEISLEEKIQELKRANVELEEFAYVASHDLQEPLRKLTTFSERLQTKFSAVLGADGLLYLDRIVAATDNMRLLIDNLLDFSRTSTSARHFVRTDLNKLLGESLTGLELQIEETGTVIRAERLPELDVIPSQLKQLFDNLLNNAIKFRKKDQKSIIDIRCEKLALSDITQMALLPGKSYYRFHLTDNGIGFDAEYQEKIFLIFQRLHGKSEYPGSGIGLAICKKIVENHNGVIFAEGNPGMGAMFSFILPENQS
ncbi:MAG: ATP-binding protein [Chitinophagaceae bacterium]